MKEKVNFIRLVPLEIRDHKTSVVFSENQIGLNKNYTYPNAHVTVRLKLVHMTVNITARHCSHWACFNGVETCSWFRLELARPLKQKGGFKSKRSEGSTLLSSPVTNTFCDVEPFMFTYKIIQSLN
jgi:hypothetical protein